MVTTNCRDFGYVGMTHFFGPRIVWTYGPGPGLSSDHGLLNYRTCYLSQVNGILTMDLVYLLNMFQVTFAIICIIHHWDCLFEEIGDLAIELLNSACNIAWTQNDLGWYGCHNCECCERLI